MPFSSVLGASSVIKPGVCTSTTRPSVPYEGQLIYETDTDRVAAYNGSAWVYTATSGLVYLTGVSFSSQTTVSFANDVFSSTYTRYRVLMQAESTSGNSTVTMRVRDNSTAKSTAAYYGAIVGFAYDGNTGSLGTNAGTAFSLGTCGDAVQSVYSFDVYNPTSTTLYTTWSGTCFLRSNGTNFSVGGALGGNYIVDEAHTGLQFLFSVAATGTYKVYAYAD